MPVVIAWLLVLVPASLALWLLAAFGLHCSQARRLVAAVLVPAILVSGFFFFDYWTTRTPPPEPGWDIFYALVSLVGGGSTVIVTLPVWFLAEKIFRNRIA